MERGGEYREIELEEEREGFRDGSAAEERLDIIYQMQGPKTRWFAGTAVGQDRIGIWRKAPEAYLVLGWYLWRAWLWH